VSSGYRFIPEEMTWKEHDDRARAMGGHLASITSAEENEQVTRISDGKPVWVGGVRKGSGNGPGADHWYWSDGQHWTYTNWHPGEPNNMGGGENRVHLGLQAPGTWNDVGEGWRGSAVYEISATITAMPPSLTVFGAGSSEVNGTYVFKPGEHGNRHWGTIAGHYQHTQNPEIFIAFQDCGVGQNRPDWNKWMVISKIGVLYASHTGGKMGVPPREGVWEAVDGWGNPGAPGGKHPPPTVHHPPEATTKIQDRAPARRQEPIEILEAVPGKPVRFKINNRPSSNDAWAGIYPPNAPDQDHGEENKRWKWLRNLEANNASFPKQAVGDWSIRVFSDGGHTLHERKDFQVKAQTVASQLLDETAEKPSETDVESTKNAAMIAFVVGLGLLVPGLPLVIGGYGPAGEENLGMIIPGWIMIGVGSLSIFVSAKAGLSLRGKSTRTQYTESTNPDQNSTIDILEANINKAVRFRINDPPSGNDAWVGIYPVGSEDSDYGEEGVRWHWLRDIDVSKAWFPEKYEGHWSIRVFPDGGVTPNQRVDFDIIPKKERWWED